jgi:DNA-binding transcriptional LysR family regulator
MFDTVLLRSFVAVVQENGFTRAAERLCLTQSAVSTHLRRLEEHVGSSLISRSTRTIVLTPEGETLMAYAQAILALNRDAEAHLSRVAEQDTIRIGVSDDFADLRLMQTLQDFSERTPSVTIQVEVGIPGLLSTALEQGHLDIVVGGYCQRRTGGRLIWTEPLIWVISERSSLALPDPLPLAFFPEPCPYREAAMAALALAGRSHRIAMVCSSTGGLAAAAHSGFAATVMPASQMESGLCRIKPEQGLPDLPEVEFMLIERTESRTPLLTELADAIIARINGRAMVKR